MTTSKQHDNTSFIAYLKRFNEVNGEKVVKNDKELIAKIKSEAHNDATLNYRQRNAIIARCNNYLSGSYGKTKNGEFTQTKIN